MTEASPSCYSAPVTEMENALQLLESGNVVGMPTETVYGLAARIDRPEGVRRIFSIKERPFFDPLIVHVASKDQARRCVKEWPAVADALAEEFWPGPLTLVLPKAGYIDSLITSGLDTVGLRCPRHPLALKLIAEAGIPLAAPSANKFGRTSPTSADHVRAEFGPDVFVLDGGPCEVGIESTVLSINANGELSILRTGEVTASAISVALKKHSMSAVFVEVSDRKAAPGQMKHHYMPAIPLIWIEGDWTDADVTEEATRQLASVPEESDGVRLVRPDKPLTSAARLDLGNDPALAARKLYAELRRLAESGADHIVYRADSSPQSEAWEGILDRIKKASSLVLRRRPGVFI